MKNKGQEYKKAPSELSLSDVFISLEGNMRKYYRIFDKYRFLVMGCDIQTHDEPREIKNKRGIQETIKNLNWCLAMLIQDTANFHNFLNRKQAYSITHITEFNNNLVDITHYYLVILTRHKMLLEHQAYQEEKEYHKFPPQTYSEFESIMKTIDRTITEYNKDKIHKLYTASETYEIIKKRTGDSIGQGI